MLQYKPIPATAERIGMDNIMIVNGVVIMDDGTIINEGHKLRQSDEYLQTIHAMRELELVIAKLVRVVKEDNHA